MFTISYKGFYIHGYCDRASVRVQCGESALGQFEAYAQVDEYKSMHSAKCYISRYLNRIA